ncbi:HCP-like protein, partial [Backusella circina FSU 941]
KDYSKAIAWFQLGANQNDSGAQFNIAFFYENGLGVSQDYPTAMEYYLKAAENNHTIAMSHIGLLFLNEKDVPLDKYKALEWLVKSGNEPGKVEELNKAGFHLDEEDKSKLLFIYDFIFN